MTKVSLVKVRNGRHTVYMLRWYADGHRRSETLGKANRIAKREADKLRRAKELAFAQGKQRPARAPVTTLRGFLDHDREAIAVDMRPATLIEQKTASDHAMRALGADVRPDRLTRADCGKLKTYLSGGGLARATINKTIKTLRAALNRGIAEGLIDSNPFAGNTGGKTQAGSMRIFSTDEIAALIDAAPTEWWALFIKLGFETGLRTGEMVNLTWADIDFVRGSVRVSAKRAKGKLIAWAAKTYEERVVPTLSPEVVEMLQRYKVKSDGSPYVFLTLDRLAAIEAKREAGTLHPRYQPVNDIGRRFFAIQHRARKLLAQRRGLAVHALDWELGTPHDMRRTFATRAADLVSSRTLQSYMGHASIVTTGRYYLGVNDASAERVREANSVIKRSYSKIA